MFLSLSPSPFIYLYIYALNGMFIYLSISLHPPSGPDGACGGERGGGVQGAHRPERHGWGGRGPAPLPALPKTLARHLQLKGMFWQLSVNIYVSIS